MSFNEHQLNIIAQAFAEKYFDRTLNIPVKINGRKNGSGIGGFIHGRSDTIRVPIRIDIAGRAIKYRKPESILDTLLHELAHWFCYVTYKDYRDGDIFFENQLRRIGASSTGKKSMAGDTYDIACSNCGKNCGTVSSIRRLSKYLRGYSQGKRTIRYYRSHCCDAAYVQGNVNVVEEVYEPNEKIKEAYAYALEVIKNKGVRTMKTETVTSNQKVSMVASESPTITHDEGLIKPGPRGVTNMQMIPAIQQYVMANDKESLNRLQEMYPSVFESSKKYIKKSLQFRFYQMIG